jgi:O-antigen ligase
MKNLLLFIKSSLFNKITLYVYLGCSAFSILLWSPTILGKHFDHWPTVYIYILPWIMTVLAYSWQIIASKEHRVEIILMVLMIILGVLNAALSDAVPRSTLHMRIFLVTGIFALWASMFILTGQHRRRVFDWFCCGCLAIIIPVEIIAWLLRSTYDPEGFQIFVLHPIPLGTVIILLSTGPIRLLTSAGYKNRMVGGLLLLASGLLIFFTHKRGTWLAVAAMLAIAILYLVRKRRSLLVTLLVVMTLILSVQAKRIYTRLDPGVNRYASVLQRLELYNFALHIWKTHPILGIGLRPLTHANYLEDYQQYNKDLIDFRQSVTKLQTLDNMVLTALVELGSLMTLAYLVLVLLILGRYMRALRASPTSTTIDWYRLLIILGLALHSLSYDSLLFPPINWLFHVQLGIMAGYYTEALGSISHQAQVAA